MGNYFGNGSDGSKTVSSSENIAVSTDDDYIVSNFTDLTIDVSQTYSLSDRAKGWLIYVSGHCTINGILSMAGKGAALDPTSESVDAAGIKVARAKSGGSGSDDSLFTGCGADVITAEGNQPSVTNGLVVNIPRTGGAGAAQSGSNSAGWTGGTKSDSPGGGGSGGWAYTYHGGGTGAAGDCFKGGAGGGGGSALGASGADGENAEVDGEGHGGDGSGTSDSGAGSGGGGAGCIGGDHGGAPFYFPGSNGDSNASGGVIILIVGGNLTFGGSGKIDCSSGDGGAGGGGGACAYAAGGGAGAGGGVAVVLYVGTYNGGAGNYDVTGGSAGSGGSGTLTPGRNGGAGGAGDTVIEQIDAATTESGADKFFAIL